MASEKKLYCSLFQNQKMLDMWRVYLEPTDEFLDEIRTNQILSKGDLDSIRKLPRPANRMELLQLLVKKRWNDDSLEKFLQILSKTQDPKFCRMLESQLANVSGNDDISVPEIGSSATSGLYCDSDLDRMLSCLNNHERNQIRVMIRDKDDEIGKLRDRIRALHSELDGKALVLSNQVRKYDAMEREVTNWIAGLELKWSDCRDDRLSSCLADVERNMELQGKQVEMLKMEKKELKTTVERLGTENKSLVDRVERLKLENQALRNTNAIFAEELDALRVKIQCGPSSEQHKKAFETPQNSNSVDDAKTIKEPVNKSRIESLQTSTSNSEDPPKLVDNLKLTSEPRRKISNEAVRKSNNDIPRSVDAKKSSKTDPRSDSAALKTKIATRKFSQITPPNHKQLKVKPDESRQRRISAPLPPSSGHTTLTR